MLFVRFMTLRLHIRHKIIILFNKAHNNRFIPLDLHLIVCYGVIIYRFINNLLYK